MVRVKKDYEKDIEFYVGTDVNGNKIPIPFENILVTGYAGTGKSTLVQTLLLDALMRYFGNKVEFRIWSNGGDYSAITRDRNEQGVYTMQNLKITVPDKNESEADSITRFIEEAWRVSRVRYNHLVDYKVDDIWRYNEYGNNEGNMIPIVYVVDSWDRLLPKEAQQNLFSVFKTSNATGVIFVWVGQPESKIGDPDNVEFYQLFPSKFVFNCSLDNSERLFGSSIAANASSRGVRSRECIYQRYDMPYVPLDIPKFRYHLFARLVEALI